MQHLCLRYLYHKCPCRWSIVRPTIRNSGKVRASISFMTIALVCSLQIGTIGIHSVAVIHVKIPLGHIVTYKTITGESIDTFTSVTAEIISAIGRRPR